MPKGRKKFIHSVGSVGQAIFISDDTAAAKSKLARSIASKTDLKAGHVITEEDIHLLSPGDGFEWIEKRHVIGKTLVKGLPKNEIIYKEHIA